ncbi:MAG: PH domain-containing protein [Treponema sp.]|jgi:uncharacterized membrane protein YdbT with pleckstrin-like domain|nr:PH domain-containing protein [Treponema sp.]
MKFIRKKNLMEGEEILYVPLLHWAYTVKHMLLSLPFFLVLLILWLTADPVVYSSMLTDIQVTQAYQDLIRYIFIAGVLVVLVIFVCRIFQYLCTEYGVTNKRLILKKGVFRITVAEIPTDRIESIYCIQGILGRMLRYGTVCISGVGGKMPTFFMAARPYALRRKIVNIIEKNKTITVVHGDMSRIKPPVKPVVEQEPIYRYGTFVRVLPNSGK